MDPPHNFQSTVESGSGNSTPRTAHKRDLLNSWANTATERATYSGSQGRFNVSEHGREPMQTSQLWGWATEPRASTHPPNTATSTGSFPDDSETRGSQGFDLGRGKPHQPQQLGTTYQPQDRMQQGWPGNSYYGNGNIVLPRPLSGDLPFLDSLLTSNAQITSVRLQAWFQRTLDFQIAATLLMEIFASFSPTDIYLLLTCMPVDGRAKTVLLRNLS